MARVALFVDGAYIEKVAANEFSVRVDYGKFVEEVVAVVANKTAEPLDLLRTYYYDCLPHQSSQPTDEERRRFARKRGFFNALNRLDRFLVREGKLAFRGRDGQGNPIYQQKRVDILLGLDFAVLSGKHQITYAVLVAGDNDFVPAIEIAKQEGIVVYLVHGPGRNVKGASTYAQGLWLSADERIDLTQDFMNRVARDT